MLFAKQHTGTSEAVQPHTERSHIAAERRTGSAAGCTEQAAVVERCTGPAAGCTEQAAAAARCTEQAAVVERHIGPAAGYIERAAVAERYTERVRAVYTAVAAEQFEHSRPQQLWV